MISSLRIENASLLNFIKHEVLVQHFVERVEDVPLTYSQSDGYYVPEFDFGSPSPFIRERGLVLFDDVLRGSSYIVDTANEQSDKVDVAGASSYDVVYTKAGIKNPDATPTAISFDWHYVAVLDSWPGQIPPPLPLVSIDAEKADARGFQLGGGLKKRREIALDIFATSKAERDDITDLLCDRLENRHVTVRDFRRGGYLNYDGTFNTSFDGSPVNVSPMTIDSVKASFLGTNLTWDHLNKFRARIVVNYHLYDE